MADKQQDRFKRLQRLRRLGVRQGASHIAVPPKPRPNKVSFNEGSTPLYSLSYEDDPENAAPIEDVVSGVIVENAQGQYFNVETRYPLASSHGERLLAELLDVPMTTIAAMTKDDRWHELTWRDVLFIDLETNGLDIAAGTIAFLIGVGYLDEQDFVVRQVFMRDFDEEAALLHDLQDLCDRFQAVASFNGKTFDLPLLENRFVLTRLLPDLLDAPHFDLLHPARRIWRRRLENCRLATLEAKLLGIERTTADVPGYLIPDLYRKYLVDQDARVMAGIFYHNEVDIVSMAALTSVLSTHFSIIDYLEADHNDPATQFHPVDILSIGLWQQALGNLATAEVCLKHILSQSLPDDFFALAQTSLAYLLKRQHRHAEAEPLWQELVLGSNPLLALEELAKYYEWRCKDFESALTCIDYAINSLEDYMPAWQQQDVALAWTRRKVRVQKKADKQSKDVTQ